MTMELEEPPRQHRRRRHGHSSRSRAKYAYYQQQVSCFFFFDCCFFHSARHRCLLCLCRVPACTLFFSLLSILPPHLSLPPSNNAFIYPLNLSITTTPSSSSTVAKIDLSTMAGYYCYPTYPAVEHPCYGGWPSYEEQERHVFEYIPSIETCPASQPAFCYPSVYAPPAPVCIPAAPAVCVPAVKTQLRATLYKPKLTSSSASCCKLRLRSLGTTHRTSVHNPSSSARVHRRCA